MGGPGSYLRPYRFFELTKGVEIPILLEVQPVRSESFACGPCGGIHLQQRGTQMKWPKALVHPPARGFVERWGNAFSSLASADDPSYLAQVFRSLVQLTLVSGYYRYSLSLVAELMGRVGDRKMNLAFGRLPFVAEVWPTLVSAFRLWARVG